MNGARLLCGAAMLALSSQSLLAQQAPTSPVAPPPAQQQPAQRTTVPILGATISTMAVDPASAARSEVGERAYGLQLDAGALIHQHLYLGIDVGGQFLDDHADFTQNTTGGRKKSNASVTYFSAIAGLRTGMPRALPVALALNVGGSLTVSRRSIDECVDCQVDKLDIPGGAFVEPALLIGRGTTRFRASDRIYGGGSGMRSVAAVGVELALGKRR